MIEQEKKYWDIIDTLVSILDKEGKIKYINEKGQLRIINLMLGQKVK